MLELRNARDDDSDGLLSLMASVYAEYDFVFDVDRELPEMRCAASEFSGRGGRFWVAEENARIIGMIGCEPFRNGDAYELRRLYVHKGWRRQGVGARLVELVEREASANRASCIELWSDTRLVTSHRFYERLGYIRIEDLRELHDLSASIEVLYRKDL